MSRESDMIMQRFPGKRIYFLAPRELDAAIAMVEEQMDEPNGLRVIYSKERVSAILLTKLKWPINRISNYLFAAYAWRTHTRRAPAIMSEEEIRDLLNTKEEADCDGNCEDCDNRDRPGE